MAKQNNPKMKGKGSSSKVKRNRNFKDRDTQSRDQKCYDDRTSELHDNTRGSLNDLSWYTKYPNLLQASASVPYPFRPGQVVNLGKFPIDEHTSGQPVGTQYTRRVAIPGVCVLEWVPSFGYSNNAVSPASVLAKEVYARIRKVYSGSLEADPPDLVVYLMALDSIYTFIGYWKRVFRIINTYSPENYTLPQILLQSMGFSVSDINYMTLHRQDLWQAINYLILQSRKFTCPAEMDIYNRHFWMSDNVYTDANHINSQFYLFNLKGIYQYQELATPDNVMASGLTMQALDISSSSGVNVINKMYNQGTGLINALVAWDDAYTINGYLLRAYEGVPSFTVQELQNDESFTPVYSTEVLSQIENAFPLFYPMPNNSPMLLQNLQLNVSQDPKSNEIIYLPRCKVEFQGTTDPTPAVTYGLCDMPYSISIRNPEPTVGETVIATRLKMGVRNLLKGTYTSGSQTNTRIQYTIICGTEILMNIAVTNIKDTGTLFSMLYLRGCEYFDGTTSNAALGEMITRWALMEQFDWHPITFSIYDGGGAGTGQVVYHGDLHNWTTITSQQLEDIHKICVYSEFNSFAY